MTARHLLIKKAHRWNAALLGLFLVIHLANHIAVVDGIDMHLLIQAVLRPLYRSPVVEVATLLAFAAQIGLGLALVRSRGRPASGWGWAQTLSGIYLALFILQHVGAILFARWQGVDTNSYFAAAVVEGGPLRFYFIPYYVLSVSAVFIHLAAALRFRVWPAPAKAAHYAFAGAGVVLGVVIVAGLMGVWEPYILPDAYLDYRDAIL